MLWLRLPLCRGAELEGCSYRHPLFDRTSPVVAGGDYITTESGTGLVHTAPGHGQEDYQVGPSHSAGPGPTPPPPPTLFKRPAALPISALFVGAGWAEVRPAAAVARGRCRRVHRRGRPLCGPAGAGGWQRCGGEGTPVAPALAWGCVTGQAAGAVQVGPGTAGWLPSRQAAGQAGRHRQPGAPPSVPHTSPHVHACLPCRPWRLRACC